MNNLLVTIVDFISTIISAIIGFFLLVVALSLRDVIFMIIILGVIPALVAPFTWLKRKLFGSD